MTNSLTMKSNFVPVTLFLSAALTLSPLANAQQSDPDLDKALKQAEEQSKKMGIKLPDVKAQLAEVEQDAAKEKAALQKQLEAPGPVALPDWTPTVPQFTADGPARKKLIYDQVKIVVTGTSPLTPAELGDAWDAARTEKMNRTRNNNSSNETKTVMLELTLRDTDQKVRLEATRAPEEKITHITVSSPIPKPDQD
ncbi:MAG: hypothetical protein WA183_19030 [Chthoniobacterales bacterium]